MLSLLATPVTAFFLLINILVGVYSLFVEPDLIGRWAFRPAAVKKGEWGRWITAGFVHTGLAHLLFNMVTLWSFGPPIERTIGWWRFLAVYMGSELAANALTYWRHRDNPAYSAVGASGAISGVVFSFVLFEPWARLGVMFIIPMPAILFAFLYIAFSIYASNQQVGRVAHEAHLGGALGGILLTIALFPDALTTFLAKMGLGG
ncbi:MAG TPA: rhomboid family intramembrane serine protease [Rubricoccaceae bacterium]|jgi:membrane associated rhomboid family serine protease